MNIIKEEHTRKGQKSGGFQQLLISKDSKYKKERKINICMYVYVCIKRKQIIY